MNYISNIYGYAYSVEKTINIVVSDVCYLNAKVFKFIVYQYLSLTSALTLCVLKNNSEKHRIEMKGLGRASHNLRAVYFLFLTL